MAKNQSGSSDPQAEERPRPSDSGAVMTEAELALATGNATPAPNGFDRFSGVGSTVIQSLDENGKRVFYRASAAHAAAAQLHGWNEHDVSDPVRLTMRDYQAALKAAEKPVRSRDPQKSHKCFYEPHPGAMSPHRNQKV